MKEYKENVRLTQWTSNGASLILDSPQNDQEAREQLMLKFKLACNRLAEIEDAIESGELVRLPCKVGDTVYGVGFNDCEESHTDDKRLLSEISNCCNGDCYKCKYVRHGIEEFVCAEIKITSDGIEVIGEKCETYRPNNLCTSRAQAEAKLKELEGKK